MAVEIKKKTIINLGNIVDAGVKSFVEARNRVRAKRSADFYKRVVDNGLSTGEQISYFKGWLEEEKERGVKDQPFITELETGIADLKKVERSEKFYEEYRASFELLKTSKKSISDHVSFLEGKMDKATDNDLRVEIERLLTTARTDEFTIENNILTNQVTLAMNDKRASSLLEMIGKVTKAKNEALAGGDEELASSHDIKLQSLNSQLQKTRITDELHNLEVDMMGRPFSPTEFLNELTTRLEGADAGNVPITINGTRYDNAKQYWEMQMNDYIEKDFLRLLEADNKEKIDTASIKLTPVLEAEIKKQFNEVDALKSNFYLEPYMEKIEAMQLRNSAYGVNQLGDKIVRDYQQGKMGDDARTNISNTIAKLTELNKQYGVDVSGNVSSVINEVVSRKQAVSEAQVQIYQEKIAEGLSPEEAWQSAISGVVATDIPSGEMLQREPVDIAKEKVSALEKAGTDDPSKFDVSKTKIDVEQPKVSAVDKQTRGEYIPHPELLELFKPEQIVTEGTKKFMTAGATSPYRRVTGKDDLAGLHKQYGKKVEDYLIRPKGTIDIFVRQ